MVAPLLKEGKDPKLPSGYIPICITCCLSKILEQMINNRLIWCLESQNLMVSHQAGFRKHHSTIDHLVYLGNAIANGFQARKHLVAVIFTLEKAYYLTWSYGILYNLHRWGFRGRPTVFIQAFLIKRKFRVRVRDCLSSTHRLENGVPQGSILSVTLFAIAVNNITSSLEPSIGKCLHVDDLSISFSGKTLTK